MVSGWGSLLQPLFELKSVPSVLYKPLFLVYKHWKQ
jgi:hypothetical protein